MLTLPNYQLLLPEQLPMDEPKGLIEGVLPQKGVAILFGPSGSGKSFVTLDLGLCVATGRAWHGRTVQPGEVLYIVAEGGHAFRKRVEGWQLWYGVETLDHCRFLLDAPDILKGGLGAVQKACIAANFRPRLVIIDTVKRTMLGDENASRDVGAWDQACRTAFPDSCIVGVHHTGHQGDRARGSSAWRDHADTMFQIGKPAEQQVALSCEKQRDWDDTLKMQLKLETLQLPAAPDGTPRTTLVSTLPGETRDAGVAAPVGVLAASKSRFDPMQKLKIRQMLGKGMGFEDLAKVLVAPDGPFPGIGYGTMITGEWLGGYWEELKGAS